MTIGQDIYAGFVNMDHRTDRLTHMIGEFSRIGILAHRIRGKRPEEFDLTDPRLQVMNKRTPGAIPCHFGQVEVMQNSLAQGKHAFVMEDDLQFCSDFLQRMEVISEFLDSHTWSIFWFGGTYHLEPTWHASVNGKHTHPSMQECHCTLNRDWEPTDHPNIVRCYGAFSTHAYLVNKYSIAHVLELLDKNIHLSMGIDWLMLLEQPNLVTYAFNPGCIKQIDSQSDISNGFARQSGFANLGKHWWADKM